MRQTAGMTDQQLLDAVNAQLLALVSGGVAEWKEGAHQVRHLSVSQLMAMRTDLENRINQASEGICFPVVSMQE
jgi:hypothetical protein